MENWIIDGLVSKNNQIFKMKKSQKPKKKKNKKNSKYERQQQEITFKFSH